MPLRRHLYCKVKETSENYICIFLDSDEREFLDSQHIQYSKSNSTSNNMYWVDAGALRSRFCF